MSKEDKIKVGISIGDLNGIGSEVALKAFTDSRMFEFCTPVIFASTKTLSYIKKQLKLETKIHGIDALSDILDGRLNVLNIWKEIVPINFGQEDKKVGAFAVQSLEAATEALKEEAIDVLVTAPINKQSIQSETFKYPGHTDYIDKQLEGDSLMFMVNDSLRVGLLTDHVAIKDVARVITPTLIKQKISTVHNSLVRDFGISKPKIAVLGINPHSGDNGVIGEEDETVLKPTIKAIQDSTGRLVYGPYAADSFFGSNTYSTFDAIVATYHDQGLIPFKTLSFGQGVNYTAGLNRIRTSPDHGTAFEIAGKGLADASSFTEAVFSAIQIYKNRSLHKELTANPLKRQPKKNFSKERSREKPKPKEIKKNTKA